MIELREYQKNAVNELRELIKKGKNDLYCVVELAQENCYFFFYVPKSGVKIKTSFNCNGQN